MGVWDAAENLNFSQSLSFVVGLQEIKIYFFHHVDQMILFWLDLVDYAMGSFAKFLEYVEVWTCISYLFTMLIWSGFNYLIVIQD